MEEKFIREAFTKLTSRKAPEENDMQAIKSPEFAEVYNSWKNTTERFDQFRSDMHKKYSAGGSREYFNKKPNMGGKYYVAIYSDMDMGTAFVETTKEESDMAVVMDQQRIASMSHMQKMDMEMRKTYRIAFSVQSVLVMAEKLQKQEEARVAAMNPEARATHFALVAQEQERLRSLGL